MHVLDPSYRQDDKGNELCHMFSAWNPTDNTWDEEEKTEQEFNADNKYQPQYN